MKKLGLLLMPLMAVSLLSSCGAKSPDYITHKFTFHGTNCKINGTNEYSHDIYENDKNVQYTITPDTGYKLPETIDSNIPYDNKTGVITISEIKADIELSVTAVPEISPVTTYTLTFSCTNCKAFDKDDKEVTTVTVPAVDPSQSLYKDFYFEGNEPFKVPLKSNISIKRTGTEQTVEYEYMNGHVNIPIIGDLTITAAGSSYHKDLESSSWDEIAEISATGRANEFFSVGNTKKVQLLHQDIDKDGEIDDNEYYQTVRIIDFNKDVDENGNAIGITFEFADLISDNLGYSIATQWNDMNDDTTANHNYLDSSVRKALTKNGNGHILWAQKSATTWSNEKGGLYTDKSVLEMLPDELSKEGILKTPAKYINIWNKDRQPEAGWEEQVVNDKLFLLSPTEMGRTSHEEEETHTIAYSLYEGHSKTAEEIRIKKQLKWEDICTDFSVISPDAGQERKVEIINFAGYNEKDDGSEGGLSLLRSPGTQDDNLVWGVYWDGALGCDLDASDGALAVAPAFCI